MTMNLYSVMEEAKRKLKAFASHNSLAERTALIDSTLNSIVPGYNDVDKHYDLRVSFNNKTKQTFIKLALLSWFLPRSHGFVLRLQLNDEVKNNSDFFELEFILQSKEQAMLWLSNQVQRRGAHWLFGNFLEKKAWNGKVLVGYYRVRKIRNHKIYSDIVSEQRRIGVGYKDKGSLPKDARGGMYNFALTSLQNEIEDNRAQTETLKLMLEGFLL